MKCNSFPWGHLKYALQREDRHQITELVCLQQSCVLWMLNHVLGRTWYPAMLQVTPSVFGRRTQQYLREVHTLSSFFFTDIYCGHSAKTCNPKTTPAYLLLKTVAMEGSEHQVGTFESQGYLHHQAEHK